MVEAAGLAGVGMFDRMESRLRKEISHATYVAMEGKVSFFSSRNRRFFANRCDGNLERLAKCIW